MSIEDVFPKSRSVRLLRRDPNGDPYDKFIDGVPDITVEQRALMRGSPDSGMRLVGTLVDALAEASIGYGSRAALSEPIEDLHTLAPVAMPRFPVLEWERDFLALWRTWDRRPAALLARDERLQSDMRDYRALGVDPEEAALCRRELERL